jgi:hypothetical protein
MLVLGSTSWPRLAPHAEAISAIVDQLRPGSYREFLLP